MGQLKRVGKGAYSDVYEHPLKVDYVLIVGRDVFKEMLVDVSSSISDEHLAHIPELTYVGALDYATVYECKRYARLTKKHWPKAYTDYLEIKRRILALRGNSATKLARLDYPSVVHNTALFALFELSNLAVCYSKHALLDYAKRNFMVDPDTGELILNDLFFEPH